MELFPYQKIGAEWLAKRRWALLADEMGLGKTPQAISAADIIGAQRICVVCPSIARYNWLREFQKFSSQTRPLQVFEKKMKYWPRDVSPIVSYEGAMAVSDPGEFDLLIADEAHYLKSFQSKRSQAVLGKSGLVRKTRRFWALSGTPAPNNITELWPLLFTFGITPMKFNQFRDHYCDTFEGPYGVQILGTKEFMREDFKKLISPFMLRRKKEDVMKELPPIYYADFAVEPGEVILEEQSSFIQYCYPPERKKELEGLLQKAESMITNSFEMMGVGRDTLAMLEALSGSVSTFRRFTGLRKVQSIAEILSDELKNNAYDKVVIFAIHRDVIEGLRTRLRDFNPATLYGGFTLDKQMKNMERFQKNPKCRVMIANITTAGTAINLTAAHQVVFAEQDWVPGNNAQAVMRCHRIGQERPVFVRFFSLANSVDERVTKVLRRKVMDLTEIFDDPRLTNYNHDYNKSSHETKEEGGPPQSIEELLK